MKQFIQSSPTWAIILVASMVLNFMLAIKTWSASNQADRLVRIETELQALNKKVDRLEDCVLVRKQADNAFLVRDSFVEKVSNQSEKEKIR